VIVTLYEAGVLGSDQRPAKSFGDTLEILAPIREDGELDVVGAEWHGAKGKELDIFGSHSREKTVRAARVVFDSRVEIFDGTHAKAHDSSLGIVHCSIY
jgi:hypothetical protein